MISPEISGLFLFFNIDEPGVATNLDTGRPGTETCEFSLFPVSAGENKGGEILLLK